MRVWARELVDPLAPDGPKQWVMVTTDANGFNDAVNIVWLEQVLKLNLNESPVYGDWGIPARQSVLTQIAPDIFIAKTQQRFAPLFAALAVSKGNGRTPTYNVSVITHQGAVIPKIIPG